MGRCAFLVVEDEPELLAVLSHQRCARKATPSTRLPPGPMVSTRRPPGSHERAVLLDLMLPGMSGWDLLAELRESKPTPVLILTARDAIPDRVRGLNLRSPC